METTEKSIKEVHVNDLTAGDVIYTNQFLKSKFEFVERNHGFFTLKPLNDNAAILYCGGDMNHLTPFTDPTGWYMEVTPSPSTPSLDNSTLEERLATAEELFRNFIRANHLTAEWEKWLKENNYNSFLQKQK